MATLKSGSKTIEATTKDQKRGTALWTAMDAETGVTTSCVLPVAVARDAFVKLFAAGWR